MKFKTELISKICTLFSISKKKVIENWELEEHSIPTLLIGDLGSGVSDVLIEISQQSISKGKILFYFSAFDNKKSVGMLSDAAQEYGRCEQFYVNDSRLGVDGAQWERVAWSTILIEGGIVGTMMPTLERSTRDDISRCNEIISQALYEISLSDKVKEVVIVIDGVDYFDQSVQKMLSYVANKGACLYLRATSFYFDQVTLDLTIFKIILMRIASNLDNLSFLPGLQLIKDQLKTIHIRYGFELSYKASHAIPCYIPLNSTISRKEFVCANKEVIKKKEKF